MLYVLFYALIKHWHSVDSSCLNSIPRVCNYREFEWPTFLSSILAEGSLLCLFCVVKGIHFSKWIIICCSDKNLSWSHEFFGELFLSLFFFFFSPKGVQVKIYIYIQSTNTRFEKMQFKVLWINHTHWILLYIHSMSGAAVSLE